MFGSIGMQVEGLCAMVSGVEELVARAERHCNALQVSCKSCLAVGDNLHGLSCAACFFSCTARICRKTCSCIVVHHLDMSGFSTGCASASLCISWVQKAVVRSIRIHHCVPFGHA